MEHWANEIKDIADTPVMGIVTTTGPLGVTTTEKEMIEHRKLQIDSRKWLLSKLQPRKYGDKLDLNVAGQPDGAPIKTASIAAVTTDPVQAAKLYQEVMRGVTHTAPVTVEPSADGE